VKYSRFSKPVGRRNERSRLSADARRAAAGFLRIQYARALMRLAAEDYETDRIVFEVRALLKPQSALREPELASRVMSMMAVA